MTDKTRHRLITLAVAAVAFFAILLYRQPAEAAELFQIEQVKVTYRSYFPGGTDPLITQNGYLPDRALSKSLDLSVDTTLGKYFYWNWNVHSMTDTLVHGQGGQFRMVGLEMRLGIDFSKIWSFIPVTAGYYHDSDHILDSPHSLGHFPVKDAVEFNFILYRR